MTEAGKIQSAFWHLSAENALQSVESTEKGLSSAEADSRLKQYGRNSIKGSSKTSSVILFLLQFKSPITLLLIGAALLSYFLMDTTDALLIMTIVMVSSLLGWWQERGAVNAVDKLTKMVQVNCNVLRDGEEREISVEEVVPGDVAVLNAGDIIPGDSLILESKELFVDESTFTGETFPVEKNKGVLPENTPLAKRSNILLMGTHVISGRANALIMKTAKQSEFGKISAGLRLRAPETDFEKGIRRFGYLLMEITLILVVIIFAVNVLLHKPVLDSLLFSLALAVGLTPQLLPAIINVNLAYGARNMAKQQVIVKRLASIENFGSMNVLCSDKTGTITQGKVLMHNAIGINGQPSEKVLHYAWLNASLQRGFRNPIDDAIMSSHPEEKSDFTVLSEVPYDFIRKRLTVHVSNSTEKIAITKGAVSQVLEVCSQVELEDGAVAPLSEKRDQILAQYKTLSEEGFRTIGVACLPSAPQEDFGREDEKEMVFLGFITMFDPLKANVKETISQLNQFGVKLKLITGDNLLVAESLAKQLDMPRPGILTGADLRNMSDSALMHKVAGTDIFAEVEPNQKERIIHALKKGGSVVGFMGDGINDASALHAADVGISVDSAVDVAKEAADIVLLNNDLEVLVDGIMEGRITFANTMKYVLMATSANFGNMFSMAGASLLLPFLPLLPKQILLTNLLTDFPETTISTDKVDEENIKRPQRWNLSLIKRFMLVFGILSSVFDFLTFGVLILILRANEQEFQTGWFLESVISASLIVLVVRTRMPFFKRLPGKYLAIATGLVIVAVLALPFSPLAHLFGFIALPAAFYGWMLLIVALYVASAELTKKWFYKKYR